MDLGGGGFFLIFAGFYSSWELMVFDCILRVAILEVSNIVRPLLYFGTSTGCLSHIFGNITCWMTYWENYRRVEEGCRIKLAN